MYGGWLLGLAEPPSPILKPQGLGAVPRGSPVLRSPASTPAHPSSPLLLIKDLAAERQ